ncbi:capsular polysaccharide transport system ATP-binding protein [Yoonia tamlensis]|uniref:Capsular polysaccharide transport system ATP-binding protein n=1 Tax=Yoonia tamlensis TaxID=390270 RepID=A0A1I6GL22_9RHOB|nr:ABC transporter ATP-binding protein [Yoonia tamlensis]SFR42915.1 capsular polysaccharide transport system ATP-binding protein [Yoonia tamlensis]
MIWLDRVTKLYRTPLGQRMVLNDASYHFEPGHNYGILGANGSGKSTLVRLISGAEAPTSGRVVRQANVSFPLGFSGTFNSYLTGRQNAVFVARVYGANVARVLEFVWDFAELGTFFDMPLNTYSSGMRARFGLGVSLAIDFDVYLIDEVTEVGDKRFRAKSQAAFRERALTSDVILVSHNLQTVRAYCDRALVLQNGELTPFDSVEDAIAVHVENQKYASDE